MILFFDTETTGLPRNYNAPASDSSNWPRLVQLAIIKCDYDGNLISQQDFIIKPQGFTIPKDKTAIHGVSTEMALLMGRNIVEVLEILHKEIEEASLLVAHNIKFDEKIIAAEFYRNNIKSSILSKSKICTMDSSKNYCAISNSYGYKWPTLSELHQKLFNEGFKEHNAKHDIFATYKCFWALNERGVIKLNPTTAKLKASTPATDLTSKANQFLVPYRINDKWGFATEDGKIIIDCIYDMAMPFSDDLALVTLNNKRGYIDKNGKQIIPCVYEDGLRFSEGFAEVMIRNKRGFINKKGEVTIPCIYDDVRDFQEGRAAVEVNNKWGFIDVIGNIVIPCRFESVNSFFRGLAIVGLNGKMGFIDKRGAQVIPCEFDFVFPFNEKLDGVKLYRSTLGFDNDTQQMIVYTTPDEIYEGLSAAKIGNDEWIYIDKTGKQFGIEWEYPIYFKEGLAQEKREGKFGYLNLGLEVVIPCIYDFVTDFSEGLAFVSYSGKYGFIDVKGKQYWE